jgi:eukaryotic-like serine/threonine-protein kinase
MPMIGKTLGNFDITNQLGRGGMGEVYQAKDLKLGRNVAIKVLPEEFARDADRVARFQREAKLLASLNHPNIAAIHGLEEFNGIQFLVLELVEGKTLADQLKPGLIPVEESLKLALQIAEALEAAHEKGVIHRDLKPANIMVTGEGSVKLLDFGLAKLYEQDASSSSLPTADFPATQIGSVLGTVAYMSPEQAQGQPTDARSDIFSFGLVLYEMLSGRRAFAGESPPLILAALLRDEPPRLQTSLSLEKIVRRCLAKQPSGRYHTISEVKTALEQVFGEKATGTSAEPQPSIAVLPFVNMSGDKEQEYFSDGLAEEIINALTQIPGLLVIARTSAFAFKGKQEDITKIGEALRVNTILEGSVRKAGNRIRVTAQLIDASRGSHLWSQRYDREMTDVFAIQDEISQAIVEKLRLRISRDRPLVRRRTESIEAYSLYLKGRHHFNKGTLDSATKSKDYYKQAIVADPNYALAWYGLAKFYWFMGWFGYMPPKIAYVQSNQAALRTVELDETLPEGHAMLGALRAIEFDWKGSEREFLLALELDPHSGQVWSDYAWFHLTPMRRLDEAIIAMQKVLEIDPLSLIAHNLLACWYRFILQYDHAIEHWRNALELYPEYPWGHLNLGVTYIRKGMINEGIQACEKALHLSRDLMFIGYVGWAFARAGRIDASQKLLKELQDLAQKAYVPPSPFALICLGLEETDQAFDWLEKAVDEHDQWIFFIHADNSFDPLRSHPRYHALLRKMNLEP